MTESSDAPSFDLVAAALRADSADVAIYARLGDQIMTLSVNRGQPAAEICREVRGVVLSRTPVPLQEWTAALAAALVTHAERNAIAAQALRKLVAGS